MKNGPSRSPTHGILQVEKLQLYGYQKLMALDFRETFLGRLQVRVVQIQTTRLFAEGFASVVVAAAPVVVVTPVHVCLQKDLLLMLPPLLLLLITELGYKILHEL
jgi:hypothetical protein